MVLVEHFHLSHLHEGVFEELGYAGAARYFLVQAASNKSNVIFRVVTPGCLSETKSRFACQMVHVARQMVNIAYREEIENYTDTPNVCLPKSWDLSIFASFTRESPSTENITLSIEELRGNENFVNVLTVTYTSLDEVKHLDRCNIGNLDLDTLQHSEAMCDHKMVWFEVFID